MTTLTLTKINLTGSHVKQMKALYKGHRHNKNIQIANYLKFEVSNSTLTVTYIDTDKTTAQLTIATDSENTVFSLPIDTIKKLSTAKNSTISFIPVDTYTIEVIENGISQKVNTIDPLEFPKTENRFNKLNFTQLAELDYSIINKLSLASLSTSKSDSRPVLTTVLLRQNKIVSTDAHRLYMGNSNLQLDNDILIPSHVVTMINSLTDKNSTLTISKDRDILKFDSELFTIFYDSINMNFPEVSKLIPEYFNTIINVTEFTKFKKTLEAIKKNDKYKPIAYLTLNHETNKLTLKDSENTIQSEVTYSTQQTDKQLDKIAFNASFLLDTIKQLESKNITIKFVSGLRPFIVEDQNNNDSMGLILPIRTY